MTDTNTPVQKLFTEQFRPTTLKNVILLPRVRSIVEKIKDPDSGALNTNPLFYSLSPGTGKTTLTRILKDGCDCLELNASSERGIDFIREHVQDFINTHSIVSKRPKVVVFEEMDGMTDQAFDALRSIIEKAGDVRFIGNCNNISKIPDAIKSRFELIPLFPQDADETKILFEKYESMVAKLLMFYHIQFTRENLAAFVKVHFPNYRNILQALQSMVMTGVTDLSQIVFKKEYACEDLFGMVFNDSKTSIDAYKVALYDKVISNYSYRASDAVSAFCDNFVDYLMDVHPEHKAKIDVVVLMLAEYADQMTRTTNPKIVLMALVFSLSQIVNNN